jgi:hypothetical protein
MLSELSEAQEISVSVLTGALGAPIAAWTYWTLFHQPICGPEFFSGSRDCVVTVSGESRSWLELAKTPDAVVLGFILAVLAYVILDVLIGVSKKPGQS